MIDYIQKRIPGKDLKPDFRTEKLHFRHKYIKDRKPEQQVYFDKLIASLWRYGSKNPLITFQGHILIGHSRWEIMLKFNPDYVFDCLEITEDVYKWDRNDIKRLQDFKMAIYERPPNFKEIWEDDFKW